MFITFEGGEGTGKTSVLEAIYHRLNEEGIDCIMTREPGGVEIAEKIRSVILDVSHTAMDERAEALLYAASRRQHLVEKVLPAIEKGQLVLCDRFIDSSLAYQGYARGIGMDEVLSINEFAIDGHMPDLTVFFDLDPQIGLERISKNANREINRLDLEAMKFHEDVLKAYKMLEKKYADRFEKIDASGTFEENVEKVYDIIKNKLKK